MRKRTPARSNYDRTAARRAASARARAARVTSPVTLDEAHADALRQVIALTGETEAALIRRLISDEAVRLHDCAHEKC